MYLADQLTLFQPGEGISSPSIVPPNFFHLPASLIIFQRCLGQTVILIVVVLYFSGSHFEATARCILA